MKIKVVKKALLGITFACIAIIMIELIAGIFGFKFYHRPYNQILLTAITLALGAIFALGALSFLNENKIISIIDLSMISLSVVMFIIFYLRGFRMHETYFKITGIVAIITIIFNFVVSASSKLKKHFLLLQIFSAINLSFIGLTLIMSIFEHYWLKNSAFLKIFCVVCVIEFGLILAITALGKRNPTDNEKSELNNVTSVKVENNVVKLTVEEYNAMLLKIKNLEDEIKRLRNAK